MLRFRLGNLLDFQKEREGVQAPVQRKRRGLLRPWSSFQVQEEDVERLKSIASSASRLEAIMSSEGWKEVCDAKIYYQSLYDYITKNPDETEHRRFRAACEYSALDGFFRELSARVRRGREAREKLESILERKNA